LAGIYLHIPFCRQKCHYCNFYSLPSGKLKNELVKSLIREIQYQKHYLGDEIIESIYFGGGTPSLLEVRDLSGMLSAVHDHFHVSDSVEITLEANPDDIEAEKLKGYRSLGINRLSIGIQSFQDIDLQYLNRVHTGAQAMESIALSQKCGFENLSVDIIYGIPTLSDQNLKSNLQLVSSFGVPHLSAYWLTVEPKTVLANLIEKGKIEGPIDEHGASHFNILRRWAKDNSFIHYEISNLCLDGFFSRHNTSYWNGTFYLGMGPSAHSFDGKSRQWNISNLKKYIESIHQGRVPFTKEDLSIYQEYNEYVMTSMRTLWGCNLELIRSRFGHHFEEYCRKSAKVHLINKILQLEDGVLTLTEKGMLLADGIAADFFILEESPD
jgi:oxygen-independent coproporphyrinogen III oxidase